MASSFLSSCFHTLNQNHKGPRCCPCDHPQKPFAPAVCISRFPYGCAFVSLVLAVLASGFGITILGADGLIPSSTGSYPNFHILSKRSDGLSEARKDSELVLVQSGAITPTTEDEDRSWGRRLQSRSEPRSMHKRRLEGSQVQQTDELSTGFFLFNARDSDGSCFDEAGLKEM